MNYQILEANNIAADIYHKQLRSSKKATEYCLSRGLTKKTLSRYRIGYATQNNILVQLLKDKELPYHHLSSIDGSQDLFKNRIVIPNIIMNNVAMFTGRAFPSGEPKFLYSRGGIDLLFNEDVVHKTKKLVVVESPICALTLMQINIPVVAKFGTGTQLLLHIPKNVKIIFLPDIESTNIGVIDAIKCAAFLNSEGYGNTKIALLPQKGKKTDPNSFMLDNDRHDLIEILSQAKGPEEINEDIFNKEYEKHTKVILKPYTKIGRNIDWIKSQVKLTDIISHYTKIDKVTNELTTCFCPFHREAKASFIIYNKTQTFFCFGCRIGGDIMVFMQRAENLSFQEALDKLKMMIRVK